DDWKHGLTGNLCRCTGYTSIIKAGMEAQCNSVAQQPVGLSRSERATMGELRRDSLDLRGSCDGVERRAFCPTTLAEAVTLRRDHPNAKVVAGATDIGVQLNKGAIAPALFLDLNRVAELEGAQVERDGDAKVIIAGARSTWTELLELCREEVP